MKKYEYKRVTHFKEMMGKFQSNDELSPSLIQSMNTYIDTHQIDRSKLTQQDTKKILKTLGKMQYYDRTSALIHTLGGPIPADLSQHIQIDIINKLMMILVKIIHLGIVVFV